MMVKGYTNINYQSYRPEVFINYSNYITIKRYITRNEMLEIVSAIFEMVGERSASYYSLTSLSVSQMKPFLSSAKGENSPENRVDQIFSRMDRVSFWKFKDLRHVTKLLYPIKIEINWRRTYKGNVRN